METDLWSPFLGLAAALGGGLLIGLERERRKRQRPGREARQAAGIRSFALAAFAGGIAQALQQPLLVALGALAVLVLAGIAYWNSLRPAPQPGPPPDPGLTTELALFVTYLVGVLAVQQPALGAAVAAVVAGLLAARERLHRFATGVLSEAEWHDALVLAALSLVLLPLAPATPLPWLAGLAPRSLLGLMLLILLLQAAGHVALRLFGPRAGLALSGGLSGFVSSTATIASMGARARRAGAAEATACAAGAMFSTAATWVQAMLLLLALAPVAAGELAPSAATGLAVALGSGLWLLRGGPADSGRAGGGAAPAAAADAVAAQQHAPLRLREAVLMTLLLAAVAAAVAWAQGRWGQAGLLAGTAIAALADAHSPVAALGALHAAGQVSAAEVRDGVLTAIGANSLTRAFTAAAAGGAGFGARVALSLALSGGAALAVALALR